MKYLRAFLSRENCHTQVSQWDTEKSEPCKGRALQNLHNCPDRAFLPRPLGEEDNPDVWDAWTPLFDWLIEHAPEQFDQMCEAEEAIRALERAGIIEGPEHQVACDELFRRFETARKLKLQSDHKIWLQ